MTPREPVKMSELIAAAETRAAGLSWEAVARLIDRPVESVRRWPTRHAEKWAQALRAAERRLLDHSANEGVAVLRQLLKSKDDEMRHQAAWRLIYQRLFQNKIDLDFARVEAFGHPRDEKLFSLLTKGESDEKLSQHAHKLRLYRARSRSRRA